MEFINSNIDSVLLVDGRRLSRGEIVNMINNSPATRNNAGMITAGYNPNGPAVPATLQNGSQGAAQPVVTYIPEGQEVFQISVKNQTGAAITFLLGDAIKTIRNSVTPVTATVDDDTTPANVTVGGTFGTASLAMFSNITANTAITTGQVLLSSATGGSMNLSTQNLSGTIGGGVKQRPINIFVNKDAKNFTQDLLNVSDPVQTWTKFTGMRFTVADTDTVNIAVIIGAVENTALMGR